MNIETLLAQTGCVDDVGTGALVAPIQLSTTYHRERDGSYPRGYVYTRHNNPTRSLLEETLAQIEGGVACCTFSSGMAAAAALFQAFSPGDHILLSDDVYHGVRHLAEEQFGAWGLEWTRVDMTDLSRVEEHLQAHTRLVWVETPSNPLLKIVDIEQICALVRGRDIAVVVDGTWTTPLLQKPLALGADFVLHSVTKYLAGHSDVLGGAVIASVDTPVFERVRSIQQTLGAVLDPFSAWLTMRGMRSLATRLRTQTKSARRIAAYLDERRAIEQVYYPGLKDHPGHAVASCQMEDYGAMLSFTVRGGQPNAVELAARTRVIKRATSLGGTESLIEHRASIEPPGFDTPDSLLRLSVGLEHVDDLLTDLDQAIEAISVH